MIASTMFAIMLLSLGARSSSQDVDVEYTSTISINGPSYVPTTTCVVNLGKNDVAGVLDLCHLHRSLQNTDTRLTCMLALTHHAWPVALPRACALSRVSVLLHAPVLRRSLRILAGD